MDMQLGDTQLIVATCKGQGLLRNQAAYVLATALWETANTMEPVEEAFWIKNADDWRRKNLRYYPWHGRGYVQVTWERNYHKVKRETGVDVVADPKLAMLPEVAVIALVVGCRDGWYTGKKLSDYITIKASDFVGARAVVNGTDKARAIAELARDYEADLISENYGAEALAPVVNTKRDGTAPRESLAASTTMQGAFVAGLATVAQMSEPFKEAVGLVTVALGVSPDVATGIVGLASIGWVFRERIKKWADGDR